MLLIRLMLVLGLIFTAQLACAGAYEDMLDAVKKDDVRTIGPLLKRVGL